MSQEACTVESRFLQELTRAPESVSMNLQVGFIKRGRFFEASHTIKAKWGRRF